MSENGIDREGIGMLYAGGTGMMIATSLVYGTEPINGWIGGSIIMALGLAYELQQKHARGVNE